MFKLLRKNEIESPPYTFAGTFPRKKGDMEIICKYLDWLESEAKRHDFSVPYKLDKKVFNQLKGMVQRIKFSTKPFEDFNEEVLFLYDDLDKRSRKKDVSLDKQLFERVVLILNCALEVYPILIRLDESVWRAFNLPNMKILFGREGKK